MQSENFDNKIRQAAEQHHPNYDEKAWTKMEKLLDRHLPQEKDRRRRVIFFLLLFLLVGGGAWLLISKPWQPASRTLTTSNTPVKNEMKSPVGSTKETTKGNSSLDKRTNEEMVGVPAITNEKKDIPTIQDGDNKQERDQYLIANGQVIRIPDKRDKVKPGKNNETDQLALDVISPERLNKDKSSSVNNTIISSPVKVNDDKLQGDDKTKVPVDQTTGSDIAKDKMVELKKNNINEQTKVPDKKEIAKKTSNKKANNFFFSFSAGPDVSSVGLDNPGKLKLLTGAGFGYTFRDRLTLRAGFYSGRKIYSASREDYKPVVIPPNFIYLDNIAANCKVFEIPVSLAYTFSQSKKHGLFAGAGLSSYIMKKENYVYLYKMPNGSTYSYTKTINDEYKHYFSVLTLSAGYERRINSSFSLIAEPYIKFPLAGVGYGKVKLNSAGVLFSLKMSPFSKK